MRRWRRIDERLGPHLTGDSNTKRNESRRLQLLVEGYTMKEVGAMLNIKPPAVAYHRYLIMESYGLKTHSEFVMFAIEHHIVESPA